MLKPTRKRATSSASGYDQNVFMNCPFDAAYAPIADAITFAIQDLGFRPRSARERLDSGEMRLDKIVDLITTSRYSIHDLSRTELDAITALPRFNMPFELGIDFGCKAAAAKHARKSILIFDSDRYRYQKYISDIAGLDVHQHDDNPEKAVIRVRHWLRAASDVSLRAGTEVSDRFIRFRDNLPRICDELHLDVNDLSFADFSFTIAAWLRENP